MLLVKMGFSGKRLLLVLQIIYILLAHFNISDSALHTQEFQKEIGHFLKTPGSWVRCLLLCFMSVALIVHQESVCAAFGSGLSSACVVDVGDQKTSVCCVEDGVSHRNSR